MKHRIRSFGFRLWLYFIIFTAIIFTVLWLLQTVFLQSFYNEMVVRNTRAAAETIIVSSSDENIDGLIDEIAHNNSVLVYITDTSGELLYSSDEFSGIRKRNSDSDILKDKHAEKRRGSYRFLPDEYDEFLEEVSSSTDSRVEIRNDNYYVCGSYIDYYGSDEQAVLYVGAVIDAVGASVTVISMQLVWVTALSVIVGFILSWFIAKRFSSPVAELSEKAKKLGEKDYKTGYKKGVCTELDELGDTLDRTNEKLNESREFQMELLANVSHDLRTPITMIKGYAEMIRDISWEDEKQCSEDVTVIIRESDRLTALVNEIMEYSELRSAGIKSDAERLDLSSLVRGAASSFETLKKPEGIKVEKEIEDGVFITGNSGRLERALYNLMDNAARHTGDSKKIKVSLSSEGNKARISVEDFGKGIPKEELPHIWDRYYTSRMRQGKGVSGLGLAIVKQIAEMHGGKCSALSEEGKGSVFVIELIKKKE